MEEEAKRVLIVADGEVDRGLLAGEAAKADLIIAADGGANHLHEASILPALILGDFDSVRPEVLEAFKGRSVRVMDYPEDKDFTDSELALEYALGLKPEMICLVGALGGRPDHELANLQLLTRGLDAGVEVAALAPGLRVFAVAKRAEIRGSPGDTLSLLPLSESVSGITLGGLRYPLAEGEFELGRPLGISNVFTGEVATVEVKKGRLLAFHFSSRT